MAQGSAHSPGEQEIFVPGREGLEGERGQAGAKEEERARDTNAIWADVLFITLCNMRQKN